MKKIVILLLIGIIPLSIQCNPIKDSSDVDSVLNIENVWKQLLKDSIQHPQIVMRQIIQETGWLKSNLCKTHNNLFGFRTDKGYLKFDSWQESIAYYKRWQQCRYKGGDYYQFLVRIKYAGDPEYINRLKKIKLPSYCYE